MSYFGLWSTTDAKQGGADPLVGSGIPGGSNSGSSVEDELCSSALLKSRDAVPCDSAFVLLAPSTPELGDSLLADSTAPGRGSKDCNHGVWEGPLTRKDPLPTPFAALANGSTSFKSTDSEGPEVASPVPQGSSPSIDEAQEDEPSTAAVVLDMLSQLFTPKSAEPDKQEKKQETEKQEAKDEDEESGPVALYFPYSLNGPPPPPPIPSECAECMTDEEEGGSVDLVESSEPASGVLEKVRDVLRKESEKQEVGEELVLLKADPDKPHVQGESSDRSTPEHPATPENPPRPSSERSGSASLVVPLLRVNSGVQSFAVATQFTEETGSDASSPAVASAEVQSYGPIIAAAMVEDAGPSVAVAPCTLPAVRTRSLTDMEVAAPTQPLEQQQSSDLYSWLFGSSNSSTKKFEQPESSEDAPVASTTPLQPSVPSYVQQEAPPLEIALVVPAAGQASPSQTDCGFSVKDIEQQTSMQLPPLGPGRRSFDGEERHTFTGHARTSSLSRLEGGSMELKSCLRSPCGSDSGDEPCAAGLKRVNSKFKMVRFAEGVVDADNPLYDRFKWDHIDARLVWMEEPSVVRAYGALYIESRAGSECWQRTLKRGSQDNAHFLHIPQVYGDFVMTTHVRFMHVNDLDQAGLMVRLNGSCWLKAGVTNHPPGNYQLGAVGTNGGYSDWSMSEFPSECNEVDLRIRREGINYTVEAKRAGRPWACIRQLALVDDKAGGPVMAGLYAAAPNGNGASAEFKFLRIEPGRLSRCLTVDSIPEEAVPRQ